MEWLFGDIVNYFKFVHFKKNLKIGLSKIKFGKLYIVSAVIKCSYLFVWQSHSGFFYLQPPILEDYFA